MKAPGVRPHALSSFKVAGSNLSASATNPKWATSKIGAVGSVLIATISPASFMPATCCIAPLMPQATYSLGRTVFPLCPTCRVFGSQSISVRGGGADDAANRLREFLDQGEVFLFLDSPSRRDDDVGGRQVDVLDLRSLQPDERLPDRGRVEGDRHLRDGHHPSSGPHCLDGAGAHRDDDRSIRTDLHLRLDLLVEESSRRDESIALEVDGEAVRQEREVHRPRERRGE